MRVVKGYLARIDSIESEILVNLRVDIAGLPTANLPVQLDDQQLRAHYDQALSHAITATGTDIGTTLDQFLIAELMTMVTMRLGVSTGILGTGTVLGEWTFGIGFVVSFIIDGIVSWVWDWCADPRGNLAAKLDGKLDEMNQLIVDGLRTQLSQFAQNRVAVRKTAVLSILTNGGAK
jgi:hypothetical protein